MRTHQPSLTPRGYLKHESVFLASSPNFVPLTVTTWLVDYTVRHTSYLNNQTVCLPFTPKSSGVTVPFKVSGGRHLKFWWLMAAFLIAVPLYQMWNAAFICMKVGTHILQQNMLLFFFFLFFFIGCINSGGVNTGWQCSAARAGRVSQKARVEMLTLALSQSQSSMLSQCGPLTWNYCHSWQDDSRQVIKEVLIQKHLADLRELQTAPALAQIWQSHTQHLFGL